MKTVKMKAISLFSGAGGMDLGFEQAGIGVVASNDSWDVAMETYAINRKNPRTFVGSLDKHKNAIINLAKDERVDMVFGGPPCQDFSSAGWRTGDGIRASMTSSFITTALKIMPEWIVMENVNTILSIGRMYANKATKLLERAGYAVIPHVLDAVDFGAPQYRKRFFLVARRSGDRGIVGQYDPFARSRKKSVTTVRTYYPDIARGPDRTEFYYRHPWSFERRAVFSIDEPSPTIRGVNRPIPPSYKPHRNDATNNLGNVRPLTTEERGILQTFPAGYDFVGTKTEREQQIGNSVPPLLAKAVATAVFTM